MKRRCRLCFASIALALLGVAPANASGLHVVTFEASSKLYVVNPETGETSFVGDTGREFLTDLAFSPSGTLFASSLGQLLVLDPTTAAAATVGSYGTTTNMVGLDFDRGGQLVGVDQSGRVFSVNSTNGMATHLFATPFTFAGDVAHAEGDILYATTLSGEGSHLIEINRSAQTYVDRGVIASGLSVASLDYSDCSLTAIENSQSRVFRISSPGVSGSGALTATASTPNAGGMASPEICISGTVEARIVSRSDGTAPTLRGMGDTFISVRRSAASLDHQITSYPTGVYALPVVVRPGDTVQATLANESLIVIDDHNVTNQVCQLGERPLVEFPVEGSAVIEWPIMVDGAASDAVHAAYYSTKAIRDYWMGVMNVTPLRWIVHVNAKLNGRSANGETASVPDQDGWLCTALPRHAPKYPEIIYHELGHRMIQQICRAPLGRNLPDPIVKSRAKYPEAAGMDEGFADYFAASFRNNSRIHEASGRVLRNLHQVFPVKYSACQSDQNFCGVAYTSDAHHYGARIFGGALWDLRDRLLDEDETITTIDPWMLSTLIQFVAKYDDTPAGICGRTFLNFRRALEETSYGMSHLGLIDEAFSRHGIQEGTTTYCFPRPVIYSVERIVKAGVQLATVTWSSVNIAQSYRVYLRRAASSGLHLNGLGILVADSLADTVFTYQEEDTSATFAFIVTGIDENGVEGPASDELPAVTAVWQNDGAASQVPKIVTYPNPSRGGTMIGCALNGRNTPHVIIYDVGGRLVRKLRLQRHRDQSAADAWWDGRDKDGRRVQSGVYMVRIEGQREQATIRVVLLQ